VDGLIFTREESKKRCLWMPLFMAVPMTSSIISSHGKVLVCHEIWCFAERTDLCRHNSSLLVSLTPAITFFSGVVDTGQKYLKSLKFIARAIDTAEKLFTGVNDTASKFVAGVNGTGDKSVDCGTMSILSSLESIVWEKITVYCNLSVSKKIWKNIPAHNFSHLYLSPVLLTPVINFYLRISLQISEKKLKLS
jgi:hypothetical protein